MEESMDEQAARRSEDPAENNHAPTRGERLRRMFGFLRAPLFWGGLVMGLVVLGAGIAIGLGAARWVDDDRRTDHDRDGRAFLEFQDKDPGEWSPQWPGKGGKGRLWHDGPRWKGFDKGGGFYREGMVPDEIWERLEGLIEAMEELVARASDNMGSMDGFLGSDRLFEGPWDDSQEEEGFGFFEEGGAFGMFPFPLPFGEFLSGVGLEECDLDELSGVWDELPDLEDPENPEELFERIEELLEEICPADSEE